MLQKFAVLLIPGVIIIGALAWALERQEKYSPAQEPAPPEELPRLDNAYTNYVGFCFNEDPLASEPATRGDLLLYGRPGNRDKVVVTGALYRLRGPESDGRAVISVSGGRGFREIRSRPMPATQRWQRVRFRSIMPRRAEWESPGEFSFELLGPVLDRSCSWRFLF